MIAPTRPPSEPQRLEALRSYGVLDTLPEDEFEDITFLAAQICRTPTALISLVDDRRQWFKARRELDAPEFARDVSFCGHAILSDELIFEVPDSTRDARFRDNPLVTGPSRFRFYAGAPLAAPNGERIGTLCVIDHEPKRLDDAQKRALRALADQVMRLFEARKRAFEFRRAAQREARLRQTIEIDQRHLQLVFDVSPVGMALVRTPEFVFERVNAAFRALFSPREYLNLSWAKVYAELAESALVARMTEVYATGARFETKEHAVELVGPDGRRTDRYFNISYDRMDPIAPDTQHALLIQTADVTETVVARRTIEAARVEAERANAAKSTFLANMSHEIRTPLGSVMGFVGLMKDPEISPADLGRYVGIVERNSHHLMRIIDDVLDLAKVESGHLLIESTVVSLRELIAEFAALMEVRARAGGISFGVITDTSVPARVRTDPIRLRQILINVVGNAIKFTERGAVELKLAFEDGSLIFRVRDTGRGISPAQATTLFQPFVQADVSTTRQYGGTGLGLVLTRKLTAAMGGDFYLADSALGVGSTFVARVAVEVVTDTDFLGAAELRALTHPEPPPAPEHRRLAGLRVLLVEDSVDTQELIRVVLSKVGCLLEIAGDGASGIAAARRGEFDVILMDIQMPRIDGYQALRELREHRCSTPVIALTAHALNEERDRAIREGFTAFTTKPIRRDALITLLETFLP